MYPTGNSFWIAWGQYNFIPTLLEDAGCRPESINRPLSYIKQWRTCLDIGSNVGFWTRSLIEKFNTVHCFEPNQLFRECFTKNIPIDKVFLHPCGLSNHKHTATQGLHAQVMINEPGNIQCETLDSFNIKDVDFIKIDVDGFEDKVLEGAKETITKSYPVINIEMKRDKRPQVVHKTKTILHKLGYTKVARVRSDEIWLKL